MEFSQSDYEFIKQAEDVASRSRCSRRGIGSVIVKDGRVLVSASNGGVTGGSCADLGGCIRTKLKIESGTNPGICYAPCAETRCICEAAKVGISIKGATVYCTHRPCIICTRNLAAAEVAKVIYKEDYPDVNSAAVAKAAGLPIVQIK